MKSSIRRIQSAIMQAVSILEDEFSDPDSEGEMDPDDIEQTITVFRDLRELLRGKGLLPDERSQRRARSQEQPQRPRRRQSQRSSSLPIPDPVPDPAPRRPKASYYTDSLQDF